MRNTRLMKIPVLIFLISGIATSELEPVASRGLDAAVKYANSNKNVKELRSQLADVQLELMGVLQTGHEASGVLETQEAGLKYALRAEQIRQAEQAECRQRGARCSSGKPRS